MQSFTYQYQGETRQSTFEFHASAGKYGYRAELNQQYYLLFPIEHEQDERLVFWVQADKLEENIIPTELVQVMGEAIEKKLEELE